MHATVAFLPYTEDHTYALEITLFGNGGFIPNAAAFEKVFGELDFTPSFFEVRRGYETDISAKFENYKALVDATEEFNCYEYCSAEEPYRVVASQFGDKFVYWKINFTKK
jgi:hypothetical protein